MKKIKVGIITHNFPDSSKDRKNAGIFVFDLAKILNKKADVVVFSAGKKTQIIKIGGIKTYFFEFKEKLGNLKAYKPQDILRFTRFFIRGKKTLDQFYLDNPNLDFVISMWAFPGGDFAHYLYRKHNIPYAIYCLGSDIYIYARKPVLKQLIINYLKEASLLLADSPDLAEQVEKLAGKEAVFLPSSSDFPAVKSTLIKPEKMTLTFLGRLEKVKGVDLLIEALGLLGSRANIFLNIIGDGSLINWIRQKTAQNNSVKIWGNLNDNKKISSVLKRSHYLVIPSRSDSIPLVFSESMKLGLPVIASDLPDLKYLINKYKVGYLFKKDNPGDLAKVIKKAINNPNYPKFEKNTFQAAEIFDLNKTSAKLMKLIKEKI